MSKITIEMDSENPRDIRDAFITLKTLYEFKLRMKVTVEPREEKKE